MKLISFISITIILLSFPAFVWCEAQLSSSDLKLIERLQDEGIFPPDFNPDDVPPDVLEESLSYYRMHLKGKTLDTDAIRNITDSRYATPESTWSLHRNSLLRGDLKSAANCFVPGYATNHMKTYETLGTKNLKEIAADMQPIEKIRQDDESAKYRIQRRHKDIDTEITYYIYFVNINGNWKIESY